MKRIQFTSDLKIQASGASAKIPTVAMNPAYSSGKLLLRDYDLPVVIDLASCSVENNIPILVDHFGDKRIGHTSSVANNGFTVQIEGLLSSDNEDVREIVRTSKIGAQWQASIGTGVIDPNEIPLVKPEVSIVNRSKRLFSYLLYWFT